MTKRLALLAVLMIVLGSSLLVPVPSAMASITGFKAGDIIHDTVMADSSSMTVTDIKNFLKSKVPNCDTNGSKQSEMNNSGVPDYNNNGSIQRWEWGKKKYNQTVFKCLRDYKQGGKTAAKIIYDKAQLYDINPRVLLVLLQKEQGLVTDTWPLNVQYRSATGYGCPDYEPCDSQYYGLENQLDKAADLFRTVLDGGWSNYPVGNNSIPWHPNLSGCGYSTVNIQNRATSALYRYTPYRPNSAALNAGYGVGNDCSSYGNRNFYLYFTDWFGSTHKIKYQSLKIPRYMQLSKDLRKQSLQTFEDTGGDLTENQTVYFNTKITVNGITYLRSSYDTRHKLDRGIALPDLEEISVDFNPMQTPRYMRLKDSLHKTDPRTLNSVGSQISGGRDVLFTELFSINGVLYLRSKHDTTHDIQRAIPISNLEEIQIIPMKKPRYMTVVDNLNKLSLLTLEDTPDTATEDEMLYFDNKITIGSTTYLRSSDDTSENQAHGVSLSDLDELSVVFAPLSQPRYMRINEDVRKVDVRLAKPTGGLIAKDYDIYIAGSYTLLGTTYLQSNYDKNRDILRGFVDSDLKDISVVPMVNPRIMKLTQSAQKHSFYSLAPAGTVFSPGKKIEFSSKIFISGQTYLRTEHDTLNDNFRGIPLAYLKDV